MCPGGCLIDFGLNPDTADLTGSLDLPDTVDLTGSLDLQDRKMSETDGNC